MKNYKKIKGEKTKKANKRDDITLRNLILIIIILHYFIILGFFLPKEVKEKLILKTNNINLINIYSHIFIHKDVNHFVQNILSLTIISVIFILILKKKKVDREKVFISFFTILLITPLVSSFFWYLKSLTLNLNKNTMGFSGVLAAYSIFILYFYLTYLLPIYSKIKFPKNEAFLIMLLIVLFVFSNRYDIKISQSVRFDIIILLAMVFALIEIIRKTKIKKNKSWVKISLILFSEFLIAYFAFPSNISHVDVISHFAGLISGLTVGFLFYNFIMNNE